MWVWLCPSITYKNVIQNIFWTKEQNSCHECRVSESGRLRVAFPLGTYHHDSFPPHPPNIHVCPHFSQDTQDSTEADGGPQVIQMRPWPSHPPYPPTDANYWCKEWCEFFMLNSVLKPVPHYPLSLATDAIRLVLGTDLRGPTKCSKSKCPRKKKLEFVTALLKQASDF